MKTPHKHAELIKAWADGAEIEYFSKTTLEWCLITVPTWADNAEFRVKPEPKPDFVLTRRVDIQYPPSNDIPNGFISVGVWGRENIKLTFDGETRELKSAEVLK